MRGLYLRGNVWWFQFRRDGHRYRVSTCETDESRAIVMARAIQEQPELASSDHLEREIDLYCDYLKSTGRSARYYENIRDRLRPWAEAIGKERSLAEISKNAMQAWFNAKLKVVLPNTAVAYLDDIRRFFKWALEKHKVHSNPCDGLTEPKIKQRYREVWIEIDQAQKLLDDCTDLELKYCLYCGIHAGMRKDEVIMSRPEWFHLTRGFVRIPAEDQGWKPKDGCSRSIPLSPEFKAFLETDYPLRSPYMIAPTVEKGTWRYRYDFKHRFNSYIRKAGLEITFHDLRRSFASIAVSVGISGFKVAEWLGDDIRLVQKVYGHLMPDDQEIARVFNRRSPSRI